MPAPGLVSDATVKDALVLIRCRGDGGLGGHHRRPGRHRRHGTLSLLAASGNEVTDAERAQLRELGAVGDISFRYYDADGRVVSSSLDQRVMGISAGSSSRSPGGSPSRAGTRNWTRPGGACAAGSTS